MSSSKDNRQNSHILVCLSSSTSNARVIHAAARIAAAFQGTFSALFVETPGYAQLSDDDKKRLRSNMNLAEKLGAKIETAIGDDVPYQIAEYARLSDVSCIVIGQTNTVGGLLRRKRSLTDRLINYAPDLDYFIIPDHGTRVYVARKAPESNRKRAIIDTGISLAALGLCTLIGFLFSHLGFTDANIIMVYLLGLLTVSISTAHRAFSLIWAVVSVLLFDLLFTTPRFTFYAYGTGYPVTFLVMFAAAFLISTLAIRLKRNARQSARTARRVSVVLETDRQLSKSKSKEEILSVLAGQLTQLLKRSLVVYPAEDGRLGDPVFYPAAVPSASAPVRPQTGIRKAVICITACGCRSMYMASSAWRCTILRWTPRKKACLPPWWANVPWRWKTPATRGKKRNPWCWRKTSACGPICSGLFRMTCARR